VSSFLSLFPLLVWWAILALGSVRVVSRLEHKGAFKIIIS
jgi:hypothetical protein